MKELTFLAVGIVIGIVIANGKHKSDQLQAAIDLCQKKP